MGSETAVEFARQKRWDRLRAVLASFGPIVRVKEHWDKHFVFVVYEERERMRSPPSQSPSLCCVQRR
jgi:hypothetical protein